MLSSKIRLKKLDLKDKDVNVFIQKFHTYLIIVKDMHDNKS